MHRGLRTFHGVICLSFALAGCHTAPIAGSVVNSNKAQEVAANKLLLLNIARAHERMPMHFSLIGQLRSGPGGWAFGVPSVGLSVPFGGAATPNYGLTLGADGQTPADVSPQSNQEFMRGMTKMLDPELIAYFAKQGWPSQMLLHLFIESIDVVNENGVVTDRLVNTLTEQDFTRFRDFVDAASKCDLVSDEDRSDTFYSTKFKAISPKEAADAKLANLVVLAVDSEDKVTKDKAKIDGYRLAAVNKASVLRFVAPPGTGGKSNECLAGPAFTSAGKLVFTGASASEERPPACQAGKVEAAQRSDKNGAAAALTNMQTMRLVATKPTGQEERREGTSSCPSPAPKFTAQFVTRSPQGVIYYLGELSRAQNGSWPLTTVKPPLKITVPKGQATLFQMTTDAINDAAVSVDYAGKTFSVPKYASAAGAEDRSVSTLSLLMLLIGLQDKGTEAPTVNNVRVLR